LPSAAQPYRLRIVLAATGGTCLWAVDEPTRIRLGYAVAAESLPISAELKERIAGLIQRYEEMAADEPEQPDQPFGPHLFGYEAAAKAFPEIPGVAEALQRELGPEFEISHDFAEPPRLVVGWNQRWARFAAIFGLAMMVLAGWFAYAIAFRGFGSFPGIRSELLVAMFAAFTLLFIAVTITYALASRDDAPVVIIDREGIFDRRLSRRTIAWREITALQPVWQGSGSVLIVSVAAPRSIPSPRNPLWAVNRLAGRLLGRPGLTIKMIGLYAHFADLAFAAEAFRPVGRAA
jgi:hypothetical protein